MHHVRQGCRAARAARAAKVAIYVIAISVSVSACAAGARYRASAVRPSAAAAAKPKPLEHSVFSRDPQGQLSEARIQQILSSPLELALPARVGVLPVVQPKDWRGPGPDYGMAPAAVAPLVRYLRGGSPFTLVTAMIPIPSGALGMEALREIAARYKLRYIVLYREDVRRSTQANPWAWGYLTGIGALCLPGATLRVDGYVEASLFDVKTGLLLFTVRRRVDASRASNIWHHGGKLRALQRELAEKVAPKLAAAVRRGVLRYRVAMRAENQRLRKRAASARTAHPAAARSAGAAAL